MNNEQCKHAFSVLVTNELLENALIWLINSHINSQKLLLFSIFLSWTLRLAFQFALKKFWKWNRFKGNHCIFFSLVHANFHAGSVNLHAFHFEKKNWFLNSKKNQSFVSNFSTTLRSYFFCSIIQQAFQNTRNLLDYSLNCIQSPSNAYKRLASLEK